MWFKWGSDIFWMTKLNFITRTWPQLHATHGADKRSLYCVNHHIITAQQPISQRKRLVRRRSLLIATVHQIVNMAVSLPLTNAGFSIRKFIESTSYIKLNYTFALQYPVSTMMYSSVSQHEMCRLWRQARAGTCRPPRARCSWCRDPLEPRSRSNKRNSRHYPDSYRMRTLEHSFDNPIPCVDRHVCPDTVPYCPDSESSEVSMESDSRHQSFKRNLSKKVTYQTKAEVITS